MEKFLKKFEQGPLSEDEIARGMHMCYRNAKRLRRDAMLILLFGAYDRAMSLCVLGLEELAKIPLLLNAALLDKADDAAWKGLWKRVRSHPAKQAVWSHYGELLKKLNVKDKKFFASKYPHGTEPLLDKFKQCSFYVSCFEQRFVDPRQFAIDNWRWLVYLFSQLRHQGLQEATWETVWISENGEDDGSGKECRSEGSKTQRDYSRIPRCDRRLVTPAKRLDLSFEIS